MMPRRLMSGSSFIPGSEPVRGIARPCFQLQPNIRQFDVIGLGGQGIRFAVEFLRQKIQFAADRAAIGEHLAHLFAMRGETVEFLADIGLGGEQDRLLVQPVAVKTLGRGQQGRHLFGQPRLDCFRLAAGGGLGARGERADLIDPGR